MEEGDDVPPTWRDRRRARTRRFIERYEQRRAERLANPKQRYVRPVRITLGVLLILFGIAIGWLPGPGFIIFALPGAFLLASEIRRVAVLLDTAENEMRPRVESWWRRMRGRERRGR